MHHDLEIIRLVAAFIYKQNKVVKHLEEHKKEIALFNSIVMLLCWSLPVVYNLKLSFLGCQFNWEAG